MLRLCAILFLFFIALASYSKEKVANAGTVGISRSSAQTIDSLSAEELDKIDSATNLIASKIDSLQPKDCLLLLPKEIR
jgi:hypothetical protein